MSSDAVDPLLARYRADFPAYARDNLFITTKRGEMVPFVLKRAQMALWRTISELRGRRKPVRIFILKARQLGFSTMTQGLAYWRTTLWPNTNGLIVAHDVDSSASLFEKSKTFQALVPEAFRPVQKLNNRKELHFQNPDPEDVKNNPGLNSRLMIQTADNKHMGASHTLQFVHLSEFARYEHIQSNVRLAMATLLQTVPELPETYVVIETTAQGFGYAKDFWDDPDNGYEKVFMSWVVEDEYTDDTPAERASLYPVEEGGKFGNEVAAYELILAELERWYPELSADQRAHEALCRIAWRRKMISAKFGGDVGLFRQEYPLTAHEAFVTSGAQVFDTRKLYDIRTAILDGTQPPTTYRYDRAVGQFYPASFGGLRVYEEPRPGTSYVIGADAGEGLERGDASVAQVLALPDLRQVATYSEQIAPDDYADALLALARKYNMAWVCPETNGPGYATVLRLAKALFYPYVYRRESFDHQSRKFQTKWGWSTNRATKTVLVTDLRSALADDLILLRDLDCIDELMHYVQVESQAYEAAPGKHDDHVIALGLALQMAMQRGYQRVGRAADERFQQDDEDSQPLRKWSFEWWARVADRENRRLAGV